MLIASDDPIMEESLRRLLNEFAPLSRIPLGRSRAARRQQARRPKKMSSAEAVDRRKLKYGTIIANFQKQRMINTKQTTIQVNRVSIGQRLVVTDKNSLPALVGNLDAEILSELTDEDVTFRLMQIAIRNKEYEGFARIDPYNKTFWNSTAVIDGCIIIDDRFAISSCLQRSVLSRLHRLHPGQAAMVDTAQYLWYRQLLQKLQRMYKVW